MESKLEGHLWGTTDIDHRILGWSTCGNSLLEKKENGGSAWVDPHLCTSYSQLGGFPFLMVKGQMKDEKRTCTSCGAKALHKATVMLTREVSGRQFTASVSGYACDACGDSITTLEDGERFDLAVAELLSETAPSGQAFRFLRKVAGLRAMDLAKMLGLSADTISRWENEKYPIDRSAFFVLGQVVRERRMGSTAMLDLLLRGEMPKALPEKVVIDLDEGSA